MAYVILVQSDIQLIFKSSSWFSARLTWICLNQLYLGRILHSWESRCLHLWFTILILYQAIKPNLPFPCYFFPRSKVGLVQKATHHLHEEQHHVFPPVHPLILSVRGLYWCMVTRGWAVRWHYAPRAPALLLWSDFALVSITPLKKLYFLLKKLKDNCREQKCKSPDYLQNFRCWLQYLYSIAMLFWPKVFVWLVFV